MASISVTTRNTTGKDACKKMRSEGDIPGIIYGLKKASTPILIKQDVLLPVLKEKILKLSINNVQEDVMFKEVQFNTFGNKILHVDFCRIDMTKKITVSIPLQFVGNPKGVQEGGVLEKYLTKVTISCLPGNIPESILVPIEHLEIGSNLRIKDIAVPNMTTIDMHSDIVVIAVKAIKIEEETPAAPAEGEEAAAETTKEPEVIKKAKEKPEAEE